jgi:hypothetical protein
MSDETDATPAVPAELAPHQGDYKSQAWANYTLQELGSFVHLLAKRSQHRTDKAKAKKDLYDARNYLRMMEAHLDHLNTTVA